MIGWQELQIERLVG